MIEYLTEKSGGAWDEKNVDEVRSMFDTFLEAMGDMPIARLTRSTVREFRDKVAKLPSHRHKRKAYRKKSIDELLAMWSTTTTL